MIRRATVLVVLLVVLVAACSDDDSPLPTSAPATTEAPAGGGDPGGFPDAFSEGYMEGCTTEAPREACQCTLDEFEKRYSLDEFMTFAADPEDPRVIEVITICLTGG